MKIAFPAMLIRGHVMHERLRPVQHRFAYPVFYIRINLARLRELNSPWFGINCRRPCSLNTRDYGARDGSDLQTWMRDLLRANDIDADGEIWLQTFPRVFGYVFNPVSFWYCYDRLGTLRAVLAEVNNTFGETHRYLLTDPQHQPITAQSELLSKKNFHVSPFCEVKGFYRFRFCDTAETSTVSLDYYDENGVVIRTVLSGRPETLSSQRIARAVLVQPWLSLSIPVRIYWQAFKLWCKRVPYVSKPAPPTETLTQSANLHTVSVVRPSQKESLP